MYTVKKYANGRVLYKHTSTRKLIMLMICINMHWNVKISQYSIWRKKKEIIKHLVINYKQYICYHSNVKKNNYYIKPSETDDFWITETQRNQGPKLHVYQKSNATFVAVTVDVVLFVFSSPGTWSQSTGVTSRLKAVSAVFLVESSGSL